MVEFLVYTISGLTTGSIYALSASGLTLTYTTTGVFNFAHGAAGAFAAFSYWQLTIGWGIPPLLGFVIVVLLAAPLLGVGLERGIMRRLERASEETKLVATVAVLLGLVAVVVTIWSPLVGRTLRPLWPGQVVEWGALRLSYNDLLVLVLAGCVAVGLRLLLFGTRTGVAMRATVDDDQLAVLNGARPAVSAAIAWAIGTSLAALAGVLVAPKLNLSPLPLAFLIVNAYAAAVIGRLRSLPWTVAGAMILGLLNDYAVGYLPRVGFGQEYLRGLVAAIPVIVLFIALLAVPAARLRGVRPRPVRETASTPSWRGTIALGAAVIGATVVLSTVISAADLFSIAKVWGFSIIALSLVPLMGYGRRTSLCQLSFAAIGAVVFAHLGAGGNPLALLAAILAAAVAGALVALPALRLSGIYLALCTAAFAVILDRWIFGLPAFTVFGHEVSIFRAGSLTFRRLRLGPVDLAGDRAFFIAGSIMFAVAAAFVVFFRRSEMGQRVIALKDSPAACATLGMNTRLTTLIVFSASAGIAGLGGAVYGMGVRSTNADTFAFFGGVTLLLIMVALGVSSIGAAATAGFVVGGPSLANLLPDVAQLTQLTVASVAIGIGSNPNGIVPTTIRPRFESLAKTPRVIVAMSTVAGVMWVLRLADVIGGWTFAAAVVAVLVFGPSVGAASRRHRGLERPAARSTTVTDGPLELLGLDRPVTDDDRVTLDRRLGVPRSLHGAA